MFQKIQEKCSQNYNFFFTIYRVGLIIFARKFLLSLTLVVLGIFLLPKQAYLSEITSENIIQLTNETRMNSSLSALSENQLLTQSAYDKAYAILDAQKFAHNINDRKFSDWIKDNNYNYSYIGENLAIDFVTSEGVINAWLDSPAHKKNIINPRYQEIGIATVDGIFNGLATTLVVQIFGTPANVSVQPISASQPNWPNLLPNNISNNLANENLLTNTALEPRTMSGLNSRLLINPPAYTQNSVYNFFEQYGIVSSAFLLSVLFVILFFYTYYCYAAVTSTYAMISSKKLLAR